MWAHALLLPPTPRGCPRLPTKAAGSLRVQEMGYTDRGVAPKRQGAEETGRPLRSCPYPLSRAGLAHRAPTSSEPAPTARPLPGAASWGRDFEARALPVLPHALPAQDSGAWWLCILPTLGLSLPTLSPASPGANRAGRFSASRLARAPACPPSHTTSSRTCLPPGPSNQLWPEDGHRLLPALVCGLDKSPGLPGSLLAEQGGWEGSGCELVAPGAGPPRAGEEEPVWSPSPGSQMPRPSYTSEPRSTSGGPRWGP